MRRDDGAGARVLESLDGEARRLDLRHQRVAPLGVADREALDEQGLVGGIELLEVLQHAGKGALGAADLVLGRERALLVEHDDQLDAQERDGATRQLGEAAVLDQVLERLGDDVELDGRLELVEVLERRLEALARIAHAHRLAHHDAVRDGDPAGVVDRDVTAVEHGRGDAGRVGGTREHLGDVDGEHLGGAGIGKPLEGFEEVLRGRLRAVRELLGGEHPLVVLLGGDLDLVEIDVLTAED